MDIKQYLDQRASTELNETELTMYKIEGEEIIQSLVSGKGIPTYFDDAILRMDIGFSFEGSTTSAKFIEMISNYFEEHQTDGSTPAII